MAEEEEEEEEEEKQQQQAAISSNGAEDFKCNICLNIASDAVVTLCGHLFCWPCLYTWLHFHSRYKECPVCKGAASETKLIPIYSWGAKDAMSLHRPNNNIPPRPPARRVEIDRHRRQRYHAERERRNMEPAEINNSINNNNPTLLGFNEASSRDGRHVNNNGNINFNLMGRETRASWLERLRAMREERLVWPVAFVHGLTSRELLQQRRQATDIALSPRLTNANLGHDSPMHEANHDTAAAAAYCQSGLTQQGAVLQRRSLSLGCMNHHHHHDHHQMLSLPSSSEAGNASHTTQYLSTMSSILSSMEVFAKALELSSASSMKKSSSLTSTSVSATQPSHHHLRVFNTPDEEQALWQSSMRGLLAQMERLMVQLQSIQPIKNSIHANPSSSTDHHQASYNHWINTANTITPTTTTTNNNNNNINNLMPPHHHHHHHHHHLDGSLTDRSRVINPLLDRGFVGQGEVSSNIINGNNVLGLSPRSSHFDPNLNMARVASAAAHCNRSSMFSLPSEGNSRELEQPSTGSKSRKRWDVTRMSR